MARVDYYAIEQAVKTALVAAGTIPADVTYLIEEEVLFQEGRAVAIYADRRDAPPDRQSISSGTRTRFDFRMSVWCYAFGFETSSVAEARDDLIGLVEIALMGNRTLSGAVNSIRIDGGEFDNVNAGDSGMGLGAEIIIIADVTAIT